VDEKLYPATWAQQTPDKPAFIMADSGLSVSYSELNERSNRVAQLLQSMGLGKGDGIAIFMENNDRFLEICWAAQRSGLYYTAISSRLTAPEVEYIVNDCGARAFFTSRAKAEVTADLVGKLPAAERSFMVGGATAGYESFEDAVAAQPATAVDNETEGADMLYSSGTTGRPKGVRVPLPNKPIGTPNPLVSMVTFLYGFSGDDVYLSPAPLYHAAPLRFTMSLLRLGATCIIMENFTAEQSLALIEKYRVTCSQWVPTMFVRMLKLEQAERDRHDTSSLRVAIHAAAPCPAAIKEQMIDWWGPVLYEYYGGTEGNGLTAIDSPQWLAHRGSVGRPLMGELHIVDDDGKELPAGETGMVYFGGGGKFEYHNDPEKTADAYNEQGWSTLGDVGYLDESGRLWFCGRKAHRVVTATQTLFTVPCEAIFNQHERVFRSALVGVGARGQQMPVICIQLERGDAQRETVALRRELLEMAAADPRTRDITTVLFHPSFPVDARHNAKIGRETLAVWAAERV